MMTAFFLFLSSTLHRSNRLGQSRSFGFDRCELDGSQHYLFEGLCGRRADWAGSYSHSPISNDVCYLCCPVPLPRGREGLCRAQDRARSRRRRRPRGQVRVRRRPENRVARDALPLFRIAHASRERIERFRVASDPRDAPISK